MAKQKDRYQAWGDASMEAWVRGDIEGYVDLWAEDCVSEEGNPFGERVTGQGLEAVRRSIEGMSANWSSRKLIENKILSANNERGIFHTWTSWTNKDGKDWACTNINIVKLDENDKCTYYKEWNVAKAKEE